MAARLFAHRAALASLCRRHRIRRLSLFGSLLKGTAGPDSDVETLDRGPLLDVAPVHGAPK